MILPKDCCPKSGNYNYEEIFGFRRLSRNHFKVGCHFTSTTQTNQAIAWADQYLDNMWTSRDCPTLLTEEEYRTMRKRRQDPLLYYSSNWVEDCMSDSLAREIQKEINAEVLQKLGVDPESIANYWFFFANKQDAIKFVIRWGL